MSSSLQEQLVQNGLVVPGEHTEASSGGDVSHGSNGHESGAGNGFQELVGKATTGSITRFVYHAGPGATFALKIRPRDLKTPDGEWATVGGGVVLLRIDEEQFVKTSRSGVSRFCRERVIGPKEVRDDDNQSLSADERAQKRRHISLSEAIALCTVPIPAFSLMEEQLRRDPKRILFPFDTRDVYEDTEFRAVVFFGHLLRGAIWPLLRTAKRRAQKEGSRVGKGATCSPSDLFRDSEKAGTAHVVLGDWCDDTEIFENVHILVERSAPSESLAIVAWPQRLTKLVTENTAALIAEATEQYRDA